MAERFLKFGEAPTEAELVAWLKAKNIDTRDVLSYGITRGFGDPMPELSLTLRFRPIEENQEVPDNG